MDRFVTKRSRVADNDQNETSTTNDEVELSDTSESEENEIDDKNNNRKKSSKKYYYQKRFQLFKQSWTNKYNWIVEQNKKAYCNVCNKSLSCNISHIERHNNSIQHTHMAESLKNQVKLPVCVNHDENVGKKNQIKIAELRVFMFVVQHNLPFVIVPMLFELIKKVAVDSSIAKELHSGRTKATDTVKIISDSYLKVISEILKVQKFSLIVDETTDISTTKSLALVVRYFDTKLKKVRDRFLSLLTLEQSDAKSIYSAIVNFFKKLDIPVENMIGFAADNAAVMMGDKNGLKSLFKEKNKNLYVLGCSCHSLHLCASAAAKHIPNKIEDMVCNIYSFFAHSSKRQTQFVEFQKYFDIKIHKILRLAKTRWLSMEAVVSRILEQWVPLKHFMMAEEFDHNKHIAIKINTDMNDQNKIYFHFLSYTLKIINQMNLQFQSESPQTHILLLTITAGFKHIVSNFIKEEFLNNKIHEIFGNTIYHKNTDEIYLGAKAELFIKNSNICEADIYDIKKNCLSYYIELCNQLCSRFDFNDQVLIGMQGLNPNNLSPNIVDLISSFPNLVEEQDIDDIDIEWRNIIQYGQKIISDECKGDIEVFWSKIFQLQNGLGEKLCPKLEKFLQSILSFPHSSAAAERVFSNLNIIKTKLRNSLSISTVSAILNSKELISDSEAYDWEPSRELLQMYYKKY